MQAEVMANLWRTCLTAALAVGIVAALGNGAQGQRRGRLLDRDYLSRVGLTRAWFAQVQLDRARTRVERAILSHDRVLVLTNSGTLQSIDALSGETNWASPLGNHDYPSLGPASNGKLVALVNGITLYVLDRADGRPVMVHQVSGAPGAAPAMSSDYCFVPMITGRIDGYPLGEEKRAPWYYQSFGRAMVAPLVTDSSLVWSTNGGYVYVGNATDPDVRYRLETSSEIVAPPGYRQPYLYVATVRGEVIALQESSGSRQWKFAAGYPIFRTPAAVGDRVYVTSAKPTLYALDAATGELIWEAPMLSQFAAASNERIYAMDDFGSLFVLDAATGATLGRMPSDGKSTALVNDQTDRLYLVTDDGLVQCLHEVGADEPVYHVLQQEPATPEAESEPTGPAEPEPSTGRPTTVPTTEPVNPFGTPPGRDADENPFGGAGEAAGGATPGGPAEEDSGENGNPFEFGF